MMDTPSLFGLAEVFGMMSMIIWLPYVLMFIAVPVVLYLVARWRQQKAGVADPDLGLKCGLGLFRVIAMQLVLLGGWMFLYSLLADIENDVLTRTAFGFLLPGGLIFAALVIVLARTNNESMPMPMRLFRGMEMMQTGLVAVFSMVAAFAISVQEDPPDEMLKIVWTLTLVYGAAWALMIRGLLNDRMGSWSQVGAVGATHSHPSGNRPVPHAGGEAATPAAPPASPAVGE